MRGYLIPGLLALLATIGAACGGAESSPTPTLTQTPAPTHTPTLRATLTRTAPTVYEELLALIPDTPETRSYLVINDYALLRKSLNVPLPGPDANQEALVNYLFSLGDAIFQESAPRWAEAPFISGYGDITNNPNFTPKYLAFDQRHVDQSAVAGRPPGKLDVMLGRFDPEASDKALEACSECRPPQRVQHQGISFYSWGGETPRLKEVFALPFFDRLGTGGRITVQDSHVFYTVETSRMEALIETSLGLRPSLLEVEEFRLLARAMSQLGAYTSYLSDQIQGLEEASADLSGEGATEEQVELLKAQLESFPLLIPFQTFATGGGVDQEGPYMALALVHVTAESAEENMTLLRRRVNEAPSVVTGQPWAELVDDLEVHAEGRVLSAKLRGPISESWLSWVLAGDQLLLQE